MITIGKSALVLAPMEGVTDAPMRNLMGESGAFTYAVSEFLRISHEIPPAKVFYKHIPELKQNNKTNSGLPVHVQLLGGDPELVAKSAKVACDLGALAIDLNFGCPAKTVNRHDGGATLLKYPHRIRAIVSCVRKTIPNHIPISAKLRLGWDTIDSIYENAENAAAGGTAWITIHGRTKEQGYRPPAYWEPIGKVKKMLKIPVVANGEIWTLEDFKRCRDQTGCEHFMIGRGALANPLLAKQIAFELGLVSEFEKNPLSTFESWQPWINGIIRCSEGYGYPSSQYMVRRIKQWLNMAHSRGAINWFDQVKRFESIEEFIK